MKDLFKILFMISLVLVVYIYKDSISNYITDNIIYHGSNKVLTYNEYYKDDDYLYVQNIDDKDVDNYQELLNMFFSIINSGDDNYSFNCNYDNCINDTKNIINNNTIVSEINNFVHPYNSFSSINIDISTNGKINVKVKKVYNNDEIVYINGYIDTFITQNISESMSNVDKIKLFHDHIINNTIYDDDNKNNVHNAYVLLTTGKSICGGYSDIMSIYLNKLNIKNYRISSSNHVWNLVNIDDKWLHLDLTWDDPVASDGNQYLLHNFFLISTDELLNLDKTEHNFNRNIYLELK